jgi:Cyclic nucleotide-binding domain
MVLGWLKGKSEAAGVEELIARRKYDRAIELLKLEFEAGRRDARLRLQLADVLALSGREREAVPILLALGDEFAMDGFAAKAISVLKKVQKIQPGRSDVEGKLASLLKDKNRPSRFAGAREPNDATEGAGLAPEMGMEEDSGELMIETFASSAPVASAAEPLARSVDEPTGPLGTLPQVAPTAPAAPNDEGLGNVLVALIEDVLVKTSKPRTAPPAGAAAAPVVVSPLFDDFDEAELREVIHGLQLRSFEPGDVVVVAGDPGDSLFVVASGIVKAFVPTTEGHKLVREMDEGQFFGEISILTGSERTATVTARTRCELLEMDRATLDDIALRRPHVREVMNEFCRQRLADDRRL